MAPEAEPFATLQVRILQLLAETRPVRAWACDVDPGGGQHGADLIRVFCTIDGKVMGCVLDLPQASRGRDRQRGWVGGMAERLATQAFTVAVHQN